MKLANQIGQKLMLAFEGAVPSDGILQAIAEQRLSGLTLFRALNYQTLSQIRQLNQALQQAASDAGIGPLLIATDHETGQFMPLGEEMTPFSGNMALGAINDPELTQKVGRAIGLELAALGVNLNYAPVCDVNSNPRNPNIGIRSFGDDPQQVAVHINALIKGMQSAGIAATAKHFPGLGDAAVDSHYEVPVLNHSRERLDKIEFPSFKQAIDSDVKLIMTAHIALPALTNNPSLPGTLSRTIMNDLLRQEMGFDGVIISDAMEMEAIEQGAGQVIDAIAAVNATVDLLLLGSDISIQQQVYNGLVQAADRNIVSHQEFEQSVARIQVLKQWISQKQQPAFDVVGCTDHQQLAQEVAKRSLTLVKDEGGQLPLTPAFGEQILVILPETADLTPADTSSYIKHSLSEELRHYHDHVQGLYFPHDPTGAEIAAIRQHALTADRLIVGTTGANIYPAQAELVNALLDLNKPMVTVALRTPYDISSYPNAQTHICTYSIQQPAMQALAAALFGQSEFSGKLPVTLPIAS